MTNPFRCAVLASLLGSGEAWRLCEQEPAGRAGCDGESDGRGAGCDWGRDVRKAERSKRRDLPGYGEPAGVRARIVPQRRAGAAQGRAAKPVRGKAGQEGGWAEARQANRQPRQVPERAKRGSNPFDGIACRADADGARAGNGVQGLSPWLGLSCSPTTRLGSAAAPPMRKPPTGEPYAGKPPVRFGGRGA